MMDKPREGIVGPLVTKRERSSSMKRTQIIALWIIMLPLVTLLPMHGTAAEEADAWLRSFEGESYGAFYDIVLVDAGHVMVTGTTHHSQNVTALGDVIVAKLTMNGDIVWEMTYGGDAMDQGLYLERTSDGGYLILGETESMGAGERDLYLVRITDEGELLWERAIGGVETEWAKDMISTADGGFLLLGETDSYNENFDVYLVRLDADGDKIWSRTLDTGHDESGTAVLEAPNGDLLVMAVISYEGGSSNRYRDTRLYRLDSSGNVLWNTLYRGDDKQAGDAMAWTTDGDIVIAGLSESLAYSTALLDFWLARVDGDTGELQWSIAEGRKTADEYGLAMSAGNDGVFLVAGLGPAFPLLQFHESGTVAWIRNASADVGIYAGFAVLELDDGSYLIPGFHYLQRAGDAFDAVLLRYQE
jgi:Domain of unknown function (DUF5122) beta-propeller